LFETMTRPIPRSPAAALHAVVSHLNARPPRTFSLDEAPHGYLAAAVPRPAIEESTADGAPLLATVNGFAVTSRAAAGDVVAVLGTLTPGRRLGPHGEPESVEPDPVAAAEGVFRVETGALLPPGCDRVVPTASATIVGAARVRLDCLPPPLAGTAAGRSLRPDPGGGPLAAAGELLGERLRATLRGQGVESVAVRPPFTVATGVLGSELCGSSDLRRPDRLRDAVGPLLEEGVRALGLRPLPLGVIGDSPDELRDAILHVRERAPVLVLAGGLGDGVTDRTVEGIRCFEAYIGTEQVALDGARHLLHAKTLGIDILAVGGLPLEAACGFDLFVRPALLALLGAPEEVWDWTRTDWALAPAGEAVRGSGPAASPACLLRSGTELRVRLLARSSPYFPRAPGQEGWVILPAGEPGEACRCHFVPAAGPGLPWRAFP
jgi:molybdopterin biosynthesis enzyme